MQILGFYMAIKRLLNVQICNSIYDVYSNNADEKSKRLFYAN